MLLETGRSYTCFLTVVDSQGPWRWPSSVTGTLIDM